MHKKFLRGMLMLLCLTVLLAGCSQANVIESSTPENSDNVQTEPGMSNPFHIEDNGTPILNTVDISEIYGGAVSDNYLRLTGVQVLSTRLHGYSDELVVPLNALLDDYVVGIPVWVDGDLYDVIIWRLWSGGVKIAVSDYQSGAYLHNVGSFPMYFVSDVSGETVLLQNAQNEVVMWMASEYYDESLGDFTDLICMDDPYGAAGLRTISISDCHYMMAEDIGVDAVYAPLIDDSIAGFFDDPNALPQDLRDYDMALCIPYSALASHSRWETMEDQILSYASAGSMPTYAYRSAREAVTDDQPVIRSVSGR